MKTKLPKPRISVMVLTRNRLDALRTCVESIVRQQYRDYEILILDDASDNDMAAAMSAEFTNSPIRTYRVESCLGVADGRNFLMEQAQGEIAVSIDDDAVFSGDNALSEVCRSFDEDPATGIVAFRITNVIDNARTPLVPFRQAIISRNPEILGRRRFAAYFLGGGYAIRKCIFENQGGYHREMIFGEEEMDLAYRTIQAGYRIAYEPSIKVDHFPMPSVIDSNKHGSSELFYHVRNRAYLAYRYLPWRYMLPYLGIWLLRYTCRSILKGRMSDVIRGMLSAPRFLRGVERNVLDPKALAYLTEHGGRLWY